MVGEGHASRCAVSCCAPHSAAGLPQSWPARWGSFQEVFRHEGEDARCIRAYVCWALGLGLRWRARARPRRVRVCQRFVSTWRGTLPAISHARPALKPCRAAICWRGAGAKCEGRQLVPAMEPRCPPTAAIPVELLRTGQPIRWAGRAAGRALRGLEAGRHVAAGPFSASPEPSRARRRAEDRRAA